MGSSAPPPTLTGASPSASAPTATSSPSPQSNSDTATLYLFTFLATILILVLLSVSLVLRSYVLRRRYRQRFQQALTEGIFPDFDRPVFTGTDQFDALGGFRRPARRLGPSPILWDTWIHPPGKETGALSSITPVAVRCHPFRLPSDGASSPRSPTTPPGSPSPLQPQPRHSIFSQLRIQSPFSLSPRPPSPSASQVQSPVGFSTFGSPRSPDPTPADSGTSEKDATTLQVCVLVAMPAASTPARHLPSDAKGKGVDQHELQARQRTGDVDTLLPTTLQRGLRIPEPSLDEERLPLLEFGVVEVGTGDWVWRS